MATGTSPTYTPSPPTIGPQTEDGRNLADWVQRELRAIAQVLTNFTKVQHQPLAKPPPTPREGLVAYADGVSWNPGSGKGLYSYDAVAGIWRLCVGSVFGLIQVAAPGNANAAAAGVPVGGFYTSTADPHVVYLRTS